MSRALTPEHKAAMREGRQRHDEEERVRKAAREVAYSAWVRKDARLYATYVTLADEVATQGTEEYVSARAAWQDNARRMPELP